MVRTIFSRHRIPPADQNRLLNWTTMVALDDLLEEEALSWRRPPPRGLRLGFEKSAVVQRIDDSGTGTIRTRFRSDAVDRAVDAAEEVFDRFSLNEEERATLYTALPCLGLHALGDLLEWQGKPPFPEVGR